MKSSPKLATHVAAIKKLVKRTSADAVEIGKRLAECKRIVGHGGWQSWLEREFGWKESTALRFMRAFDLVRTKSANLEDLADLPVSVLYEIAAPNVPQSARDEVIAHTKQGVRPNVRETRKMIIRSRPARDVTKEIEIVVGRPPEEPPTIVSFDIPRTTDLSRWLTSSANAISRWNFSDDDLPMVVEELTEGDRDALSVIASFVERLAAARRLN
jgi:hypothetical protein